jgi:hypothetical protein
MPENQRDCSLRSTAAASRCWWHKDDKQCTVDSGAYSRAATKFVRGRNTTALQDTERTKRRLAQSRSMWHGQRWQRKSRSLCRTVFTVSQRLLETNCHARWVRSYTQPSSTRSCTSTSCTLGFQEMGNISITSSQGLFKGIPLACAVSHG